MSVTAAPITARVASGEPLITVTAGRAEVALLDERGRVFAYCPADVPALIALAAAARDAARRLGCAAAVVETDPEPVIADAWADADATVHAWLAAHPLV